MNSAKVTPAHLEREAWVYVRQSTPRQVRESLESQRRQYGLAGRARKLGFARVEVVDDDLGISGTGTKERPGFARLLAAVCEGRAGAVLSLEASRLARNSRDWHHLIDLCALTGTLVIDADGVYEPKQLNDRLLLGLKGTMSEYEVGLLHQRAHAARRRMIERGEVLTQAPVGYVRTEDRGLEITPDRQVQEAIRSVFAKFFELGSARQVLLWFHQEKLPLPSIRPRTRSREVSWRLPGYSRVLSILKNPTYAGTFVHGRRRSETRVIDGRARKTEGHEVPRSEWPVVLHEHHEGYISWAQYEMIIKQLKGNAQMTGRMTTGAPRSGRALLAGLLRCARCGRRLFVAYSGRKNDIIRYHCRGANTSFGGTSCISFAGRKVDQVVAETVVEAIAPAGVEAALCAWEQRSGEQDDTARQLDLAVERARYEAERIRRQYAVVEPENRLVAAELEGRWNTALERLTELEQRLECLTARKTPVEPDERRRLLALGADLRAAWERPESSPSLKKRLLRSVLEELVADVAEDPPRIVLKLHWAGGIHTEISVKKNRTGGHRRVIDADTIELIRDLAQLCEDDQIARVLNRLQLRTGTGKTWTAGLVKGARGRKKIRQFDPSAPRSWVTLSAAAHRLGISYTQARRLLQKKILPGVQRIRYAPWVIQVSDLELSTVQRVVRDLKSGKKSPSTLSSKSNLSLFSNT